MLTCDATTRRALYSLIQFTTVSLLYSIASTLGDFQVGLCASLISRTTVADLAAPPPTVSLHRLVPDPPDRRDEYAHPPSQQPRTPKN